MSRGNYIFYLARTKCDHFYTLLGSNKVEVYTDVLLAGKYSNQDTKWVLCVH